jgi:hypothetical protein
VNDVTFANPPRHMPSGSAFFLRAVAKGRLSAAAISEVAVAIDQIEAGWIVRGIAGLAHAGEGNADERAISDIAEAMGIGLPLQAARAVINDGAPGVDHCWVPLPKRPVESRWVFRCDLCGFQTEHTREHDKGCPVNAIRAAIRHANEEETDR